MFDFLPSDNYRRFWWSVLDHSNGLLLCDMGPMELCVCNPATRRWTIVPWPRKVPVAFDPVVPEKQANRGIGKSSNEKPSSLDLDLSSMDEDDDMRHLMELEWPRTSWTALFRSLLGAPGHDVCGGMYLAFDPAISPHYDLFVIPAIPEKPANTTKGKGSNETPPSLDPPFGNEDNDSRGLMESERPPTPWTLNMFSSRTGQWEERDFVRKGEPAGTIRDMLVDRDEPSEMGPHQRYAVYYQGALYVHCRGFFVLRLSLSDSTYQVIKTPSYVKFDADEYPKHFDILGFHPYKEVVYLNKTFGVVVYHLNNSKVQYLGNSRPESYYYSHSNGIYDAFVYTPCTLVFRHYARGQTVQQVSLMKKYWPKLTLQISIGWVQCQQQQRKLQLCVQVSSWRHECSAMRTLNITAQPRSRHQGLGVNNSFTTEENVPNTKLNHVNIGGRKQQQKQIRAYNKVSNISGGQIEESRLHTKHNLQVRTLSQIRNGEGCKITDHRSLRVRKAHTNRRNCGVMRTGTEHKAAGWRGGQAKEHFQ
uniref:Uncharacterized protein n=1 Tax=Aegilops tauschii TaxID=37682 RepID=M8BB21_AEGTA